jgi:hypothetical protein
MQDMRSQPSDTASDGSGNERGVGEVKEGERKLVRDLKGEAKEGELAFLASQKRYIDMVLLPCCQSGTETKGLRLIRTDCCKVRSDAGLHMNKVQSFPSGVNKGEGCVSCLFCP